MLKKITCLFLIVTYTTIIFQSAFTFIAFNINKEFIVSTVCVEKDFIINSCQGSCYLSDEINSDNSETNNSSPIQTEISNSNFIFVIQSKIKDYHSLKLIAYLSHNDHIPLEKNIEPITPPPQIT